MFTRLEIWLKTHFFRGNADSSADLHKTGAHMAPRKVAPRQKVPRLHPEFVAAEKATRSSPARNKFVREDTGTHETLKIFDDSIVDSGDATGIDPYNTGGFDRSKNWDRR